MNVLIIGSGGREHAIAYKIKQSSLLKKLFIAPGNPGTSTLGTNLDLDVNLKENVILFCKENNIELVIIGPEKPLVDGLADSLRENGINVFGPNKAAAKIEGEKIFAKKLMKKYNIPTASFVEFSSSNYNEAAEYISKANFPMVVKANGLAAGKGVVICNNVQEAEHALEEIFIQKVFGNAGDKIVIEEFLTGEEASIFAVTDGKDFVCLPSAQDHKRIGDNDTGKNTGGMGAYSPAPIVTNEIQKEVEEKIIRPVLEAMAKEGVTFNGCLYCGLMLTKDGPKVIEFNCRFGDPETQVVLPLLNGDLLKLLHSAATGNLDKESVSYSGGVSVCVIAASKGYPETFEKGFEILGLDQSYENVVIFHSGTSKSKDKVVTSGGRVLGITSILEENNIIKAKEMAYKALNNICFDNLYFRKDISDKAIKKVSESY